MGSLDIRGGAQPVVLTVPGLRGSGPRHWQTLWEALRDDVARVELGMWDTPHRNVWLSRLDEAIRRAQGPVILAAHSLGCQAVAWWAHLAGQTYGRRVAGALLVAPADVDGADCPDVLRGFAPSPRSVLPFPSILVASSDDPWLSIEQARHLGGSWGSAVVEVGARGHINADSGLGEWEEGLSLLERIIAVASGEESRTGAPAARSSGTSPSVDGPRLTGAAPIDQGRPAAPS